MKISVQGLGVKYHMGVEALRDVSFEVEHGEFVALIGPSGCGKSTILNAIASLVSHEEAEVSGKILMNGVDARQEAARAGTLGYVFQRDALFPWRNVLQNVEAGLEVRGMAPAERRARTRELIQRVGLTGFEDYFPHKLSGGMRQRTALIRTLAYDPQLILMDEPFGALDAHTRLILQAELLRIWAQTRKTIIFVTHDLAEAITLGQRVILFSRRPGTIIQVYDIPFPYPRDPFELHGSSEFAELHASIWRTVSREFRADVQEVQ